MVSSTSEIERHTRETGLVPKHATGNFRYQGLSDGVCRASTIRPMSDRKTKSGLTASAKKNVMFRR